MNKVVRRRFLLITMALLLSLMSSADIYAIANGSRQFNSKVDDKYYSQGIRYYRPYDCENQQQAISAVGGEAVVSGSTAREKVWSGLKSLGITDEVAAGIMGNMIHEGNRLNPAQYEGSYLNVWEGGKFDWENNPANGYGVGLIQWSGGRRVKIMKYIKSRNSTVYEKYMLHPKTYSYANNSPYGVDGDKFIELADSEDEANALFSLEITYLVNEELKVVSSYKKVFEETSVQGAADYFLDHVEIPRYPEKSRAVRRASADEIFRQFSGQSQFAGGSSSTESTNSTTSPDSTGSNVLWIGDSISVNAYGYVKKKWSDADIKKSDTVMNGKMFAKSKGANPSGIKLVEKYESEGRMRDVLVFELGTNGDKVTEDQLKDLFRAAKTPKTIILVTNFDLSGDRKERFESNNKLFRSASEIDSRVVVADWEASVKNDAEKYYMSLDEDTGVHPNSKGSEYLVEVIARAAESGYAQKKDKANACNCDDRTKLQTFASAKYQLTDSELAGIISVLKEKTGSNLEALKTEASLLVNLFEKNGGENLVEFTKKSKMFSGSKYNTSYTGYSKEEFGAAKAILVNGNRIMPSEVIYRDYIKSGTQYGVKYAENDGVEINREDRTLYKSGTTKITNSSGKTYIFYKFASDSDRKGNIYGYDENNPPSKTTDSTSKSSADTITWEDGWIKGGMEGYYKDDATSWGIKVDKAANQTADANKILLHSTETPGNFGDTVKSLYPEKKSGTDKEKSSRAPHFTVDMRNKKTYQHYPLTKTSGASIKHDDIAGIQIAIIGYTADKDNKSEWNLRKKNNFSEEDWAYLAKLIIATSEEIDSKAQGGGVDWTNAKEKMTVDIMEKYDSIMGHMHVPDDNQTDPMDIWQFLEPAIKSSTGDGSGACGPQDGGGSGDINATAIKLAWPVKGVHGPGDPKEDYRVALNADSQFANSSDLCVRRGSSCDVFVATVMRYSGADKDFDCCGAANVLTYLRGSRKYTKVTNSRGSLKAGDIRSSSGHVEMVVEVNGELKIASASNCDRTGEIGGFYENDFEAFRFTGSNAAERDWTSSI